MVDGENELMLRKIFSVASRLIALWFLINIFVGLPVLIIQSTDSVNRLVINLSQLIISILIFFGADWLAKRLIPAGKNHSFQVSNSWIKPLVLGIILVAGVIGLFISLPQFVNSAYKFAFGSGMLSRLLQYTSFLTVSICFILGAIPLTRLILKGYSFKSLKNSTKKTPLMALFIVLIVFVFIIMLNIPN